MNDPIKLGMSLGVCYLVAFTGSLFTAPEWYVALAKPTFAPPGWIFAPVWLALYTLMGISAFLVWRAGLGPEVRAALAVFVLQLAVNASWSAAFFGLRSPLAGLAVIAVLWVLIVATALKFYRISKTASMLLLPYLLWVSFAALLNLTIWRLNP